MSDQQTSSDPSAAAPSERALPDNTQPTQPNTLTDSSNDPTQQLPPQPEDPASFDATADRDLDAEINHTATTTTTDPTSSSDVTMTNTQLDGANDSTTTLLPPSADQAPLDASNTIPTNPQAVIEPRIPQKKDASLRSFLSKMDDYTPLIPDAVTDYYLTLAGLPPPPETDRRLARLLALATQKFVADIAADAYQYSRIRSTNTTSNNPLTGLGGAAGYGVGGSAPGGGGGDGGEGGGAKGGKKDTSKSQPLGGPRAGYGGGGAGAGQGRTVLTMEDLGMAVGEYGVNVKRGEFYR